MSGYNLSADDDNNIIIDINTSIKIEFIFLI